jgi:hypothetical protein
MKFRKFGQISLALAVSLAMGLGVTSCSTDHSVGYFYVTGTQYNQISGFAIDNNLGQLTPIQNSPYGSGGVNPIKALTANRRLHVLPARRRTKPEPTSRSSPSVARAHSVSRHPIPARATNRLQSRPTLPAHICLCSIQRFPIRQPAPAT